MGKILLFIALLAVGCGGGPPRPVTWADLEKPEALNKINVSIEGYPGVLVPATNTHKGEMRFFLLDMGVGVTSSAQHSVAVELPAGEGPNHASPLPDSYTEKDLKIHCVSGTATYRDKIRVEGWVEVLYGGATIHARKIEKLP